MHQTVRAVPNVFGYHPNWTSQRPLKYKHSGQLLLIQCSRIPLTGKRHRYELLRGDKLSITLHAHLVRAKNQLKFIKDQNYEIEMAIIPTIQCNRQNPLDAEMLCVFGLSHNLRGRQVVKRPVAANHQGRSGYTDTFFRDNTVDEQATG